MVLELAAQTSLKQQQQVQVQQQQQQQPPGTDSAKKPPRSSSGLGRTSLPARPAATLQAFIEDSRRLSNAYIDASEYRGADKAVPQGQPCQLPAQSTLLRFAPTPGVNLVVPTATVPVDLTLEYPPERLPLWGPIEPTFVIPGGKSRPKLLTCVSPNGVRYRHLIKGKYPVRGEGIDDPRQDAIMEQLFGLVNHILRRDPEAQRRMLAIRTYVIVPVTTFHGLIEVVENALPLSKYLFADPVASAHSRYRKPNTLTHQIISKRLSEKYNEARSTGVPQDPRDQIEAMREIFAQYPPVMRHFFTEHFPDPAVWFERRVAYTRSVATASIVGFIVGLGDRHMSNIMIDTRTAEVVHIDLGVAFDAGKTLTTPELVPFRLTRDVVDGMGVTKTEGVFRRCAEETLRCIRSSHALIMTIAQVLLHDPLFSWTIARLEGDQQQQAGRNYNAEAVLVALREKLAGRTQGSDLTVQAQVEQLIHEATAIENLATIYHGWAPYA